MRTFTTRIALMLALGSPLLAAPAASGASPDPCQVLPAGVWSSVMGYTATAKPGDGVCTYEGPRNTGGGQFRILANTASSAEAKASATRMRARPTRGSHNPNLAVVESQGTVVFSIALFQKEPTGSTASQLQKLVAAARQNLPK